MDNKKLNVLGNQFVEALSRAEAENDIRRRNDLPTEKIHVIGAGRTLTVAYEQLRNAAEYTEEHLLLQRAIRRFYKRQFLSRNRDRIVASGEDLVVELTLAGYIANDTVPVSFSSRVGTLAAEYYDTHQSIVKDFKLQPRAEEWMIGVLAVEVEAMFNSQLVRDAFVEFAYQHFAVTVDKSAIFESRIPESYDLMLFVAVHRALLKSDAATIRQSLLGRYRSSPKNSDAYIQTNQMIDTIIDSDSVERIVRIIGRRGATLRIVWRLIQDQPVATDILKKPGAFLAAFETQVQTEYAQMNSRINKGIVKSVIFLIITKFIIGIAIEVPFDYVLHGAILWLPLVINLFFPPLYMILLRFTLVLPGYANTAALIDRADALFYGETKVLHSVASKDSGYKDIFNALYAIVFLGLVAAIGWGLWQLGFTFVHLTIFFIFLSTASFLGFRMSRMVREIEAVDAAQSGLSLVRDFLYVPFVVVGRWMSDKYAKVNIVAMVLDMAIELPLKTILHLVRQWGAFISSKKDEL